MEYATVRRPDSLVDAVSGFEDLVRWETENSSTDAVRDSRQGKKFTVTDPDSRV